jgi:acyl carrier protein
VKAADVTHDQVADELLRLLERAGVDPADITPATPLAALYLDSVDHAEIREALHERFGIELEAAELAAVRTVSDGESLIHSKLKAA